MAGIGTVLAVGGFGQGATTDPVGFQRKEFPVGFSGFAAPLVGSPVFVGRIGANSANSATFDGTGVQLGTALGTSDAAFLEVLTGPLEGERIDLDEATTIAANGPVASLDGAAVWNTRSALATNALAGATCAIRRHLTIKGIQSLFSPALTGNNNAKLADRLYLFESGSWIRYALRGDGASWRKAGETTDYANKVIPPGNAVLVEIYSVPKAAVQVGLVRVNAFRMNLAAGMQCIAPPYPVDLSPTALGAFVDTSDPVGVRWVGNNNAELGDNLYPFVAGSFIRYNLRSDGVSWRRSGDSANYSGQNIVPFNGPTLLKRNNADPAYLILRPFSL
jgi:hypothetical protein